MSSRSKAEPRTPTRELRLAERAHINAIHRVRAANANLKHATDRLIRARDAMIVPSFSPNFDMRAGIR